MQILFAHCSGLGQFEYFAPWLQARGWQVTLANRAGSAPIRAPGIRQLFYRLPFEDQSDRDSTFYACRYAASNAQGFAELALSLRDQEGYRPDVVIAHCGWGIGLCVKDVWPDTVYVAYHEWYYTHRDWARQGRPETELSAAGMAHNRPRNLPIIAEFDQADACWTPNDFQASRFPQALRSQLTVTHDGVDLGYCAPDPTARIDFPWLDLGDQTEIVTYATRGAEPTRGFPQFMRAIAALQPLRPQMQAVVVGDDRVAYGNPLADGDTWHLRMIDELELDLNRVHFVSTLNRDSYRRVLQASQLHVYFSEPFVLSWSFAEALACGCLVVGSDCAPVNTVIEHGQTGLLAPLHDPQALAQVMHGALGDPGRAQAIRRRARAHAEAHFDAETQFAAREQMLRRLVSQKMLS